jgi:hypothetical protein
MIEKFELGSTAGYSNICTVDGATWPCNWAGGLIQGGAAVQCPNNDCSGISAVQGAGGSTILQQWIPASTTIGPSNDPRADFLMTTGTGYWQITGRIPDYYQFSASFNPLGGGFFGFTLTFTVDRYNNVYITPGVNIAKGFKGSLAMTYGYMKGYEGPTPPSPNALNKFLTGGGCSAGFGAGFLGKSVEWSSGGIGTSDPILMTPQVGISCGHTF